METKIVQSRSGFLIPHQFTGLHSGPRLLVLEAVHGNETCGASAIERILTELSGGSFHIRRGTLTLVPVTNPLAYQLRRRQGDRSLNRNLSMKSESKDFEDQIANVLCPLLEQHDVLLDLHSFHTAGDPFIMVGPKNNKGKLESFSRSEQEERLVAYLGPKRVIEGWLPVYAQGVDRRRAAGNTNPSITSISYGVGTSEYMRQHGGYGVTLECGQHEDPRSPQIAYHAIRQTIALLQLANIPIHEPTNQLEILRLVDVVDREHIDDAFTHSWSNFDTVKKGQIIGRRHTGQDVIASDDGHIVFPNSSALAGNEWFYFAQKSDRKIQVL